MNEVTGKQGQRTRHRRAGVPPALSGDAMPPDWSDGRLEIRPADRVVLTDGRHLQLTPSQLGLLVELLRHAGSARSREQLMAAVWGPGAEASTRAVDVAIARLRAQLRRRIPGVAYVHTDFRSGYRFQPEPAE